MEDAQFLQELYDIVKLYEADGYEDIISAKNAYPYLYHLSAIRQNLIDWIPMNKEMRVLERSAECGALTGRLLAKAGIVTSVTENAKAASIIRERCKAAGERITVLEEQEFETSLLTVGETEENKYDVILLVGNFYRYKDELVKLREVLAEGGRLIVADANRLGLKYFAGCAEEYRGTYFSGVEGYEDASGDKQSPRCYSRGEYIKLLQTAGFEKLRFYYPYPDYKFPNTIYSDEWLPKQGELGDNRRNFERDRLQLFDEQKVYDSLLKEGLFRAFSNSYLIEARI